MRKCAFSLISVWRAIFYLSFVIILTGLQVSTTRVQTKASSSRGLWTVHQANETIKIIISKFIKENFNESFEDARRNSKISATMLRRRTALKILVVDISVGVKPNWYCRKFPLFELTNDFSPWKWSCDQEKSQWRCLSSPNYWTCYSSLCWHDNTLPRNWRNQVNGS